MTRLMFAMTAALMLTLFAAAPASAQTTEWELDKPHSTVVFKIAHLGVSHTWGRFNTLDGSYATGDAPRFDFTVEAASIDTGNEKRDDHLRSADFFNVKQFPTISFTTTEAKPVEGGYEVTGDLTLHGVTRSITVNVIKVGQTEFRGTTRSGFDSTFTIKRSDFGMDKMMNAVGDEVELHIAFEGIQK